jgi:hypothetical protein
MGKSHYPCHEAIAPNPSNFDCTLDVLTLSESKDFEINVKISPPLIAANTLDIRDTAATLQIIVRRTIGNGDEMEPARRASDH